jgi:hypothetical protein
MPLLDAYVRRGMRALPVWALLLFLATLTHQPAYQTDFTAWSRYLTTDVFLVNHLVGSILGAGIGILGFIALSIALTGHGAPRLAVWALVTGTLGNTLTTAVFGVAAFAQPASATPTSRGRPPLIRSTTTSTASRCSPRSALGCCS